MISFEGLAMSVENKLFRMRMSLRNVAMTSVKEVKQFRNWISRIIFLLCLKHKGVHHLVNQSNQTKPYVLQTSHHLHLVFQPSTKRTRIILVCGTKRLANQSHHFKTVFCLVLENKGMLEDIDIFQHIVFVEISWSKSVILYSYLKFVF